jgi:hypothetical protein
MSTPHAQHSAVTKTVVDKVHSPHHDVVQYEGIVASSIIPLHHYDGAATNFEHYVDIKDGRFSSAESTITSYDQSTPIGMFARSS